MKREHDKSYLRQIHELPCVLTGRPVVHAAHIRYHAAGKRQVGMGEKPDDKWVVPLCPDLHTMLAGAQHNHNERLWWEHVGVDPVKLATELYKYRDDPQWQQEILALSMPSDPVYIERITQLLNPKEQDNGKQGNRPGTRRLRGGL